MSFQALVKRYLADKKIKATAAGAGASVAPAIIHAHSYVSGAPILAGAILGLVGYSSILGSERCYTKRKAPDKPQGKPIKALAAICGVLLCSNAAHHKNDFAIAARALENKVREDAMSAVLIKPIVKHSAKRAPVRNYGLIAGQIFTACNEDICARLYVITPPLTNKICGYGALERVLPSRLKKPIQLSDLYRARSVPVCAPD